MTTEQQDWLDDERAGRHAPKVLHGHPTEEEIAEARKDAPFGVIIIPTEELGPYFDAADSEKPDPMGNAPLADRLRAMGAIHTKVSSSESVEWVNAPLAVVVEQAKRAASAFSEDLHDWAATPVGPNPYKPGTPGNPRVTDAEEHTHHTREARDQCAAGDHKYAKLLDAAAEREKIAAHDEAEGRPHLAEAIRELIDRPQGEASMIAAAGWCMPSSQVYNFLPTDEEIKMAKRERRKAKKARRRAERRENQVTTMAEEPIEERLRRAWLNGYTDGYSEGFNRAAYQTNWER